MEIPSPEIPEIPVIDLSLPPSLLHPLLRRALESWGFFYLLPSPIPSPQLARLWQVTQHFFSLPLAEKAAAGPWDKAQNAGYRPASKRLPKEQVDIRKPLPSSVCAYQQQLPPYLEGEKQWLEGFQRECHALGLRLLGEVERALGLQRGVLGGMHCWEKAGGDNFQLMYYPPAASAREGEEEGSLPYRLGAHTDWGTLTLLFQHRLPGLQIRPPCYVSDTPEKGEVWVDAPVKEGAVLVNVGDMLGVWTAGRARSVWHRVAPALHGGEGRYCAAYFLHPGEDEVIDILPGETSESAREKYPGFPKTAKEHLRERVREVVERQGLGG